jgi:ubiquinone/menaquinone biosynthesis C-methylase UbiE
MNFLTKKSEEERTGEFWDRQHWREIPPDYWASNPIVQAYINRRTTGDPDLRWLDWFQRKYVPQTLDYGLCLACGAGTAEIHAMGIQMFREMDACDLSENSLQTARSKAESCGLSQKIRYFQCNLNQAQLASSRYDAVLCSGGLHHIENLEHVIDQVKSCLKPGGLVAIDEYIGPARLQYTDLQLQIIRLIIETLPSEMRTGKPVERPGMQYMLDNDPSEAVRSPELIGLLKQEFEVLETRYYGGTLMNPLFGCGAVDTSLFRTGMQESSKNKEYSYLLPTILLAEELLTENGVLPSDYAVIILRHRQ